jgi:cytidyltransferase-like protein
MRVLTFGVFDYFHYGHLKLFQRAKALGDHLTVAVQRDSEIHKTKPQAQILYTTEQRLEMVDAICYVDAVMVYDQVDTAISQVEFDILAVGPDQTHPGFRRAMAWCAENGKQVVVLERTAGICSSGIKENLCCDYRC